MAHLYAGTSGFAYASWKPAFYPPKLPAKQFLAHYSQHLNGVEINYTFRQLPSAKTIQNWDSETHPGFMFALKAPMRITHVLRLKDASQLVEAFFRAIEPLLTAGKLGPVLFQLPPQFQCDLDRLADFLALLPKPVRCAFEFRHVSWLATPVYDVLQKHGAALCIAESEKLEVPEIVTTDFAYYRFRKPEYSAEQRKAIRDRIEKLLTQGKDVFVFFKHEVTADGAVYAQELLKAVPSF